LDLLSSKLEIAKGGDPDALQALLAPLDAIAAEIAAPAAMRTMAKRLSSSVQGMIDGESSMDDGVTRLAQGVEKLQHSFEAIGTNSLLDAEVEAAPSKSASAHSEVPPAPEPPAALASIPPASTFPQATESVGNFSDDPEDLDLLRRFVERQKGELENFEVALLEREKGFGGGGGDEFVCRYLHTLKGEFGVLDLNGWAELIHSVESLLEKKEIDTEGLFRLKDLLQDRLGALHTIQGRIVSPEDVNGVLGGAHHRESDPQPQAAPALVAIPVPAQSVDSESVGVMSTFGLDSSFLADFVAEGGDHIRNIEKSLLRLEVVPTEDEALNMVFRSCHTLKGLAGFLELKEIQRLAHAAENLMDRARNHQIVLHAEHVDILLETTDLFRGLVDGLEKMLAGGSYQTPAGIEDVIARLKNAANLEPVPVADPEAAKKPIGQVLVDKGLVSPSTIDNALREQVAGDPRPLGEILIDKECVAVREVGQALGDQTKARGATPAPTPPAVAAAAPAPTQAPTQLQQSMAVEESIRVPVQRLDMLIDTIGEAVIAQSMVWADPAIKAAGDLSTEKKIAQATQILRQIQELSMSLRMVSIRSTFQKMSRLVRDLARKLDKQIDLSMEGEDTELDKTVVENIGDPLIHMVRNSVDHGVGMPAERVAEGKHPEGKVVLRAYHKAGSVFIEIEDDGKGLDKEAILRKAIEGGKARAEQVYSEQEIYQMIFLPGLSTAKVVTDVSGRGVGMDVVKKNIEALRGTVEIRSEKGKGTCFTIRLPLTLAIIQGMVVKSDESRYIVPTLSILTTVLLEPDSVQTVIGKGEIMNLRGELIRLIRMNELFGRDGKPHTKLGGVVLVVEDMVGHKAGLVVDEILEQQQVVIKGLGEGVGHVAGISGAAIMNDGSVSLIVDVSGVVKIASG
jgi:two-component system chemotaxis sensor kinase CheA